MYDWIPLLCFLFIYFKKPLTRWNMNDFVPVKDFDASFRHARMEEVVSYLRTLEPIYVIALINGTGMPTNIQKSVSLQFPRPEIRKRGGESNTKYDAGRQTSLLPPNHRKLV